MRMSVQALLGSMLFLAGCVTGPSPLELYAAPADAVEKIRSGEWGAVVVDVVPNRTCSVSVSFTLRNVGTDDRITKVVYPTWSEQGEYFEAGKVPSVVAAPPGRYILDSGRCVHASGGYIYTFSLNSMALWLKPIEVQGGRITYPGTPYSEKVSHEFGIALTIQEKLSGRTIRSSDEYYLYDVRDDAARVRQQIGVFNPQIVERFDDRTTSARLDKEVVRKMIADAYKAEASEVAPDDAAAARNRKAARTRLSKDLGAYVLETLEDELKSVLGPRNPVIADGI